MDDQLRNCPNRDGPRKLVMILGPNLSYQATGAVLFVEGRTSDEGTRARRGGVAGGGPRATPVKMPTNELYGSRGKRIKEGKRPKMTSWSGLWPHLERRANHRTI